MPGPNGAGKSTLVALLGGTLAPTAGQVTLDGRALAELPARALARRRAVLRQENPLGFRFRAEEVVALGRSPHAGCGRERDERAIERALGRADAVAFVGRDCTTLSGGERQRVHLARVLAQLDRTDDVDTASERRRNPFRTRIRTPIPSGESPRGAARGDDAAPGRREGGRARRRRRRRATCCSTSRRPRSISPTSTRCSRSPAPSHATMASGVLSLARTLARDDGVGVLAVLHDPNLAALHADRVAVLERGRLHALGEPAEVLDEALFRDVFELSVDVVAHPRRASRPLIIIGRDRDRGVTAASGRPGGVPVSSSSQTMPTTRSVEEVPPFEPNIGHTPSELVEMTIHSDDPPNGEKKHMSRLTAIEPGSMRQDLKSAGLKLTLPRQSILEILEKADPHHLSAEDVYRALLDNGSDVGLATVYRVLTQFESAGLVTRHHFDGGQAVFELDTGDNHDHIVCMKSGRVAEFKDKVIERRLNEIAKELGYELHEHKIVLYGEHIASAKGRRGRKVR